MATYKFPQWNVEIVNPVVTVIQVNDLLLESLCNANVLLATDSAQFMVTFYGYSYSSDWNDQDIVNWVNNVELPQYEV
jgi:hypothetical protein